MRRSLQNSQISKLEGEILTLAFNSIFYLEKVNSTENIAEVENALKEIFGSRIKIVVELNKVKLEPEKEVSKMKSPVKEPEDDLVDKALEVFGGEVVN